MNRPDGYCRLTWDDQLGYWVYKYGNARKVRATDLMWPNACQRPYGSPQKVKEEGPEYEPYPLQHLAHALRCQPADVLQIIGRYGEFYRKRA